MDLQQESPHVRIKPLWIRVSHSTLSIAKISDRTFNRTMTSAQAQAETSELKAESHHPHVLETAPFIWLPLCQEPFASWRNPIHMPPRTLGLTAKSQSPDLPRIRKQTLAAAKPSVEYLPPANWSEEAPFKHHVWKTSANLRLIRLRVKPL